MRNKTKISCQQSTKIPKLHFAFRLILHFLHKRFARGVYNCGEKEEKVVARPNIGVACFIGQWKFSARRLQLGEKRCIFSGPKIRFAIKSQEIIFLLVLFRKVPYGWQRGSTLMSWVGDWLRSSCLMGMKTFRQFALTILPLRLKMHSLLIHISTNLRLFSKRSLINSIEFDWIKHV